MNNINIFISIALIFCSVVLVADAFFIMRKHIKISFQLEKVMKILNEEKWCWLFNTGKNIEIQDFLSFFSNRNILKLIHYYSIFRNEKYFNFAFLLDHNIEVFESTLCEIVHEMEMKERKIKEHALIYKELEKDEKAYN